MLYLTTRDKFDTYTVFHTLSGDTAANGGLFLPFRIPKISAESLQGKSFCDTIAEVLNLLFSCRMSGKEVEFCVGRYPLQIQTGHQKIYIAQLWRNLDGSYEKMERRLAARICNCPQDEVKVTSWIAIGIRIAVLFGVFAQMLSQYADNIEEAWDIAVPAGDFRTAMAVAYCREMGLSVANLVCACDHDSVVWDFLHRGELRTCAVDPAITELERLIHTRLGVDEVLRYCDIRSKGGVYTLDPAQTKRLSDGTYAAVVSVDRLNNVISNVYRTSSCILDPVTAAAYGGLMDYRARSGESRRALLLADQNPMDFGTVVCDAVNMTAAELKQSLTAI